MEKTGAPEIAVDAAAAFADDVVMDALFGFDDDDDDDSDGGRCGENNVGVGLNGACGSISGPLYPASTLVEVRAISNSGSQLGLFCKVDLPPGVLILVRASS